MKRTSILILLSFLAVWTSLSAYAADDRLFGEIAKESYVESVYIGKAGLRFAKSASIVGGSLGNLGADISKVESIEVIECDEPRYIPQVKKMVKKILDENKFEMIVESKDEDEISRIYAIILEDPAGATSISRVIIESYEPDEYSVVYIKGCINLPEGFGNDNVNISVDTR